MNRKLWNRSLWLTRMNTWISYWAEHGKGTFDLNFSLLHSLSQLSIHCAIVHLVTIYFPLVCFDRTTICFGRILDPACVDSIVDFTKISRSFCQPQSSCIHNWKWQGERVKKQFLHPLWERLEIQLQPRLGPTIKHHEVLLWSFNNSNIISSDTIQVSPKNIMMLRIWGHFLMMMMMLMMLSCHLWHFVFPRVHFVGQRWGGGMENQQIAQTNLHTCCFQCLSQELQNLLFGFQYQHFGSNRNYN